MLSETLTLKGEVITFVGPVTLSGFETVNHNEILFLADLARDAGAIVSEELSDLTTIVVASELCEEDVKTQCSRIAKVLSEEQFLDNYLTEVITGAEWE